MAKTSQAGQGKKEVVKRIIKLIEKNPIIGIINMEGLPTPQLQVMRTKLRDKVKILVTKKRMIKIALEEAKNKKENLIQLKDELKGMPALVFTAENPFRLKKILDKNKSQAPAKAGQTAPNDIVIKAGPTSFSPGPIIGELGALGLQTGVEEGKVVIKDEKVVVEEGEEISQEVASVLSRMGVKPMEIGLNLVAVYEDGMILPGKVLSIDEKEYNNNLIKAAQEVNNLALESGYVTKENRETFIIKAVREAKSLGVEAGILAKEIINDIIIKAQKAGSSLKGMIK